MSGVSQDVVLGGMYWASEKHGRVVGRELDNVSRLSRRKM